MVYLEILNIVLTRFKVANCWKVYTLEYYELSEEL